MGSRRYGGAGVVILFPRALLLLLSIGFFAIAPVEARLNKVPLSDAKIITPSATHNKKFETKKFKTKKARVDKKKGKSSESQVIEMDELSDKKLVKLVERSKKIEVIQPENRSAAEEINAAADQKPHDKLRTLEVKGERSTLNEKPVDHLTESAPEQVEISKEKKKKKWQFWKKKQKED